MTPEQITTIAGIVLSLLFSYVPGLRAWYAAKDSDVKALVMLVVLTAVVVGALGLSCIGWLAVYTCTAVGLQTAVWSWVMALIGNQTTYLITRRLKRPGPYAG